MQDGVIVKINAATITIIVEKRSERGLLGYLLYHYIEKDGANRPFAFNLFVCFMKSDFYFPVEPNPPQPLSVSDVSPSSNSHLR